jgi:hypothetical protein
MTPEAQRIAIAEACGWKYNSAVDFWERNGSALIHGDKGKPTHLPDYLLDLNAMHEAEKVLTPAQRERFRILLDQAVHKGFYQDGTHHSPDRSSATAAQRAEAFLRALKLWHETR